MPVGATRRLTLLDASVVGAILLLGGAFVHAPFHGDQFLYLEGARSIAHGGVLYRDFWDLKGPLVYYGYALAGSAFGFGAPGIHVFEALYQAAFALVLVFATKRWFRSAPTASFVPLLAIAPYYAFATDGVLASVEGLVGFPLFVSVWAALEAFGPSPRSRAFAFAGGVAGAAVVLFKIAFAPVVAGCWIVAIVCGHRRMRENAVIVLALATLGFALPLVAFAAYFARAGALHEALRTAFVYPAAILRNVAPEYRTPFVAEAHVFVAQMWPIVLLAVFGAVRVERERRVPAVAMIVWIAIGGAIAASEVWSYDYRFFLVVVPLGVLATFGAERVATMVRTRGLSIRVAFGAVGLVMLISTLQAELRVRARWDALTVENRIARVTDRQLLDAPGALRGPIFVFGNPRAYAFSGRPQASPINGWSPQLLLPEQWHRLHTDLAAGKPAYIAVDEFAAPAVRGSKEMSDFIATNYTSTYNSGDGTWYAKR